MIIGFLCHIVSIFFLLNLFYFLIHLYKKQHKIKKLKTSFPLFVEQLRHSMIAGHSFVKSFENIIPTLPQPLKEELQPFLRYIHTGCSLETALLKLKINKLVPQFHAFSLTMPILLKNGSEISPFLRKLETQLKLQLEFQEKMKTQSRHISIQALLCVLLPWFTLLGFSFFEPELIKDSFLNPFTQKIYLLALGLNILGFFLIKRWISSPPILTEFPQFLDSLALIIETGQSWIQAFCHLLPTLSSSLHNKFKKLLHTLLNSSSRKKTIEDFLKKEEDPHIERFLFILLQSLHKGSSLSLPLKNLSEDLYFEKTQELEKEKQNLYFKLLIPLFLFILPSVFLVILSPLFLHFKMSLF